MTRRIPAFPILFIALGVAFGASFFLQIMSCSTTDTSSDVPKGIGSTNGGDEGEPDGKNESGGQREEGDPKPLDNVDPAIRDELTLVLGTGGLELNPLKSFKADEAQLFTGLYEGLFSYDPFSLEPVPALVSRWELSEDKRTWTFTLKDKARYWNGDTVRASHLRDAWLAMMDPANNAAYSSLFDFIEGAKDYRLRKSNDKGKIGLRAPDSKTLVVTLAAPAAYFPRVLCHHSFSAVHPDMLRLDDWSKRPVLSNGPYYILEHQQDRLILGKNELYWDAAKVVLKRITVRFAADGTEAAALYDSGEAQWVAGDIDLDALKDRRGISVNPMFATHYYYIRSAVAPWNDRRVRRALALALPWEEIRKEQLLPAPTLVYPIPEYPKMEGMAKTDGAEAKRLLVEAGFPDGKDVPELVLRITPSTEAARVADLMTKAWTETLSLKVRVDVVPYESYFDSMKKDDYVVGSSTWIGDFADPYTFLQMWRTDSNLNDAKFNDPEFENLVDRSLVEEGSTRYKTLAEAEKLLLDWGVVMPISYTPALNIIDTDEIDGWYQNPLDIHPFKYLSYAAYRPLPGVALVQP